MAILLQIIVATACTIERSDNGALDGYWQLSDVDTLATNGHADMRQSGIFWAVQARLLEVRCTSRQFHSVFFRFEHNGNSLFLSHPIVNAREAGDSLLTDPTLLRPYGLTQLNDTLHIGQLSVGQMVLESRQLRMHFRKY